MCDNIHLVIAALKFIRMETSVSGIKLTGVAIDDFSSFGHKNGAKKVIHLARVRYPAYWASSAFRCIFPEAIEVEFVLANASFDVG
ncbi:hypothetical protein R1flu_006314 [Riccia fluitans]|uniref:Uncharacterized protein n=1 Tax=Riccia fluitans TaxID=41844 RepID=A0ABD1YVN8_9MARC